MSRGGAERDGERESQAGSALSAPGSSVAMKSRQEPKSRVESQPTEPPRHPLYGFLNNVFSCVVYFIVRTVFNMHKSVED